ncbi:hypothetical protein [Methylobacterium trifolii]|uniref:hypothetical protein n=1 Tax=Methylobacterium trifolii TaxID=1003092 RepID=UPI001EDE858B|nr:hypothetical protein [Methylobacterium trifolii]
MAEIKKVLEKHGKVERFGVNLLHKHFDLEDTEVLVESSDKRSRTTTEAVYNKNDPEIVDAIDTSWYLGTPIPSSTGKCRSLWHVTS